MLQTVVPKRRVQTGNQPKEGRAVDTSKLKNQDCLLYATDDERRAIRIVKVFLGLVDLSCKDGRQTYSSLDLDRRTIHQSFQNFAKNLSLLFSERECGLYELKDGVCGAVVLHERAYGESMSVGGDFIRLNGQNWRTDPEWLEQEAQHLRIGTGMNLHDDLYHHAMNAIQAVGTH